MLQDFRLKFTHYTIGSGVTIMTGASAARLRDGPASIAAGSVHRTFSRSLWFPGVEVKACPFAAGGHVRCRRRRRAAPGKPHVERRPQPSVSRGFGACRSLEVGSPCLLEGTLNIPKPESISPIGAEPKAPSPKPVQRAQSPEAKALNIPKPLNP